MRLFFQPGTEWRHSVATDVLGAVIEAASGLPLPEAVAACVTGPLGMSDTGFVVTDADRLAAPYRDSAIRSSAMWSLPVLFHSMPSVSDSSASKAGRPVSTAVSRLGSSESSVMNSRSSIDISVPPSSVS